VPAPRNDTVDPDTEHTDAELLAIEKVTGSPDVAVALTS
jgi:hypothetical protein